MSAYIATLPWYDSNVAAPLLDRLWQVMAVSLGSMGIRDLPRGLTRQGKFSDYWQSPQLLLSQCCGPDLFTPRGAVLSVIGRPVFTGLDCTPGSYYSHIVARCADPGDHARIAVNSVSSYSGYFALIEWMRSRNVKVSETQISGSHLGSLTMVKNDIADIAAIDAHLVNQMDTPLELPLIGRSRESLAPPYVFNGRLGIDRELLFEALTCAINQCGQEVGIAGVIRCGREDYANACEQIPT